MRTYGRIANPYVDYFPDQIQINFAVGISAIYQPHPTGSKIWVEVTTDDNGYNDGVYLTTLIQNLLLYLNESPFYANRGIPAKQSVIQQVAPDYYMALIQQEFSQYFASLTIAKQASIPPTYLVSVTTQQGYKINASVPIPQ